MDAELLLADMEFFEDDTPENTDLKNSVIELYTVAITTHGQVDAGAVATPGPRFQLRRAPLDLPRPRAPSPPWLRLSQGSPGRPMRHQGPWARHRSRAQRSRGLVGARRRMESSCVLWVLLLHHLVPRLSALPTQDQLRAPKQASRSRPARLPRAAARLGGASQRRKEALSRAVPVLPGRSSLVPTAVLVLPERLPDSRAAQLQ